MPDTKNAARTAANEGARPDLETALAEVGIHLSDRRRDQHRVRCPRCAEGRHRRDATLGVTLDDQGGAVWHCFRCAWRGALFACHLCRGVGPTRTCPCTGTHDGQRPNERRPSPRPHRPEPPPSTRPPGLSDRARDLWQTCQDIAPGTPAAVYLEGRGCALPENDVRWHPQLRHPSGYTGPALVALVTDVHTVEPISLHRTWLAPDGSGKAPIDQPRLLLKGHRKAGGVIRLVEDTEVTLGLALAEGLETALTTMRAFQHCWSCIDAGNLAAFPVLAEIEALTIVEDRDPAGQAAARACADRWLAAGVDVWIWHATAEGEDFNDVARRAAS
jgi:hypothetical protein